MGIIRGEENINFYFFFNKAGDNFSVCVLNLVLKVSTLPSLLGVSLIKVVIKCHVTVRWSRDQKVLSI